MYDIAAVIPVLNRPHRVEPLVRSFVESTDRGRLVFVVDWYDREELTAVLGSGADYIVNDDPTRTTFAAKANLGYWQTDEPWLLFCGDDVHFHPGWVEHSIDEALGYSFISTNDMGQPRVTSGTHAVHPIMRRSWIDTHGASWDGPGVVCHEGYRHQYVDDEWTAVAKAAGEYMYAPGSRVEHLHPMMAKASQDDTYELGRMQAAADRALFVRRLERYG